MPGQGRHQHLETESFRSHFVWTLGEKKRVDTKKRTWHRGQARHARTATRCSYRRSFYTARLRRRGSEAGSLEMDGWTRWFHASASHRRREREKRASRNQELLRSRPSPSGKGLLVRPPCGQLDICPCCAAQPASPTACLAACPGAARPPAPQQLCHVVLLRARARAKARADGRRERAKRTPDRGEGWAKQKQEEPRSPSQTRART